MTCTAHTYTHTHKHTYSEETEESLFHFTVVLFHILLESEIGGFQLRTEKQDGEGWAIVSRHGGAGVEWRGRKWAGRGVNLSAQSATRVTAAPHTIVAMTRD